MVQQSSAVHYQVELDDSCCEPDAPDGETLETVQLLDDDKLVAMAKALGHPVRLRIIRILLERRACITGDLVAELPLAQSTVSEHLRILREAGLIKGEIEGPRTSYCINAAGLAAFKASVEAI